MRWLRENKHYNEINTTLKHNTVENISLSNNRNMNRTFFKNISNLRGIHNETIINLYLFAKEGKYKL